MTEFDNDGEERRLDALLSLDILDTPPERAFDRITALARFTFKVPIVTVTLIDRDRQWFKSKQGLESSETPREVAICNYTVQQNTPLIIPDCLLDPRTSSNPLVLGEPNIRFYAGAPLILANGERVGSLCLIDREPRTLTPHEVEVLRKLAELVVEEFELRLLCDGDTLTGARTRRAFIETMSVEMLRSRRHDRPLSVITLALVDAAALTEVHGQAATDAILVRAVEACRNCVRASDTIGRIGATEFAVLLPETGLASASTVSHRLSGAIARNDLLQLKASASYSLTFGSAECGPLDQSAITVLEAARSNARHVAHYGQEAGPASALAAVACAAARKFA